MSSKAGSRWEENEVEQLKREIEEGQSWLSISEKHGRSVLSVQLKSISKNLKECKSDDNEEKMLEDISKKLGVDRRLVESIHSKYKNRQEKKKNDNKTKENKENNNKYSQDAFKMLWDFKIYLIENYDFGNDIHEIFDNFVKSK